MNKFEVEGFKAQKGLWNLAKEENPDGKRRHAQGGDAVREYKAMHAENFLSSWPREAVTGKEESAAKA